jgi:hypothetical protein
MCLPPRCEDEPQPQRGLPEIEIGRRLPGSSEDLSAPRFHNLCPWNQK